jgi:hypothetical protein
VPKVIENLSVLVGAATDSTNDIVEVLRLLTSMRQGFPSEAGL